MESNRDTIEDSSTHTSKESLALRKVANLYRSGKFSDVTFIVENTVFKLHKNILANSCPYFEAMLFGLTNESYSETITLRKTSKKLFEKVLEFIYLDICATESLSVDEFIDLICLAQEYQFQELFDALVTKIKFSDSSKMPLIISIFNLPFIEEFQELKSMCVQFLLKHSQELVKNTVLFTKLTFKSLRELVTRDDFAVKEIDLFFCLKKWREIKGEKGKEVFTFLRLNLIYPWDYIEFVKPSNLIDSDYYLTAYANNDSCDRCYSVRDVCEKHSSFCEAEITDISVLADDGSQYTEANKLPLSLSRGDTIVVKMKEVSCKMKYLDLNFKELKSLNHTFGVKICGNGARQIVTDISSKNGVLKAKFSDRIVDKIKITYFGSRNKSGTLSSGKLFVTSIVVDNYHT